MRDSAVGKLKLIFSVQTTSTILHHDGTELLLAHERCWQAHRRSASEEDDDDDFKDTSPSIVIDVLTTKFVHLFHDVIEQSTQHPTNDAKENKKHVVHKVMVRTEITRRLFELDRAFSCEGRRCRPGNPI